MAHSSGPRSYHLFALPKSLLETLTPRDDISSRDLIQQPQPAVDGDNTAKIVESSPDTTTRSTSETSGRSCNVCQETSFANVDDQRNHFRSDWHRYNVKLRLNGKDAIAENKFAQLVEGSFTREFVRDRGLTNRSALEDSLSGSASESTDEDPDAGSDKRIATLLSRATLKTHSRPPSPSSAQRSLPVTPLTWFHSPPSTQIGVYRTIFSSPHDIAPYLDQLRDIQNCREPEGKKWALFLVAGGHFAGAVVRVHRNRSNDDDAGKTKKGKPKKVIPDTEVILHKTFHRYTSKLLFSEAVTFRF